MDHTVSPLDPWDQALWDFTLANLYTGMVRETLEFLHRRPDVIITQVITVDNSLRVMCSRIRNKIGYVPNPAWVRSQCRMIAVGRGLTGEP